MTYVFPNTLAPLREYLKKLGFEGDSIKTSRQAAFVAQQLLGTRIKFPPQGEDMVPTLLKIQQGLEAGRTMAPKVPQRPMSQAIEGGRAARPIKGAPHAKKKQKDYSHFHAGMFATGIHIFCDGAAVPNPGAGGWGVVVYRDGVEIDSQSGGDPETTNNQMEMTGLLVAIEKAAQLFGNSETLVTIWCDSQYCVEGVNTWMKTWKARGWNKRKLDSPKRDEGGIKNLELWQAIDGAMQNLPAGQVSLQWVKGHIGVAGNERADELAEQGRQAALDAGHSPSLNADDLDGRYRQIMGAM